MELEDLGTIPAFPKYFSSLGKRYKRKREDLPMKNCSESVHSR